MSKQNDFIEEQFNAAVSKALGKSTNTVTHMFTNDQLRSIFDAGAETFNFLRRNEEFDKKAPLARKMIEEALVSREGIQPSVLKTLSYITEIDGGNRGFIYLGTEGVGRYRIVPELRRPLFYFRDKFRKEHIPSSWSEPDENGECVPKMKLCLCGHETPAMEFRDVEYATPELHAFLEQALTNHMTDPWYKIHKAAGAFFQGGSCDPNGKWFMIEFWHPSGAEAFVNKFNAEYRHQTKSV